jgi:hypothetical protein
MSFTDVADANSVFTSYKIPISIVATWPKPNYINPERRTWVAPVGLLFEICTTLLLAARLWVRITRQAGRFSLDDALMIGAWVRKISFLKSIIGANTVRFSQLYLL